MTKDQLRKLRASASWRRIVPSLVTLSALFFGFASILATLESMRLGTPHLLARSAQYIMLALILDGLDGNLARWLKGTTDFGAESTPCGLHLRRRAAVLIYAVMPQGASPAGG